MSDKPTDDEAADAHDAAILAGIRKRRLNRLAQVEQMAGPEAQMIADEIRGRLAQSERDDARDKRIREEIKRMAAEEGTA